LNPGKKITALFLLMAVSALYVPAQTNTTNTTKKSAAFDTTGFPQWVKDLRRWEIVAFGSIPFTMFFTTFGMDMYRWNNANGMDMSEEGRQYAPWPLKSAGADLLDKEEFEKVFKIAACLSVGIAFTDLVIVQVKRYKERKKAEALPVGTTIINRKPWPEEEPSEQDGNETDESSTQTETVTPEQPVPPKP
jgi:hypothetical protein